ncbi:MAG: hypothetical protein AB1665_08465 [Candidatus Thermoplasmatota archaeon]
MSRCPYCNGELFFVPQHAQWYCPRCQIYHVPSPQHPEYKEWGLRRKAALALIVVAIVCLAAFSLFVLRGREERRSIPRPTIYEIAEIRGLDVMERVPYRYVSREDLNESLDIEGEWMERTKWGLVSLLLLDRDDNLTQLYRDSYTSLVLGYYDMWSKEIVIVEGAHSLEDKLTLAHELTHALQDQHFDLTSFMWAVSWDEELARRALVEGDAVLTEFRYFETLPEAEQEMIEEGWEEAEYPTIPYGIMEYLAFPYIYGVNFTLSLFVEGNMTWEKINGAFSEPPASTEQVMHIEKYHDRELPVDVDIAMEPAGMPLVMEDTMGEFMVYAMLKHYIPFSMAYNAAEGWGGDRHLCYANDTDFISIFKIVWDTPADASEFYSAYRYWLTELPPDYAEVVSSNSLRIGIQGCSTTIYYSSDPRIIDGLEGQT